LRHSDNRTNNGSVMTNQLIKNPCV
jgi:hypothetical protein